MTMNANFALGCSGIETEEKAHVRALRSVWKRSPLQAQRSAASLELFMRGIYASPWQEVAWSFSRLTGDGFPVEFGFSSGDEAIRYTTEVAGPEMEEARRLDKALQDLASVGAPRLPERISTFFHKIQEAGSLRYGAWVGSRHNTEGEQFKLYVEIPRTRFHDAYHILRAINKDMPILSACDGKFVMIGYELNSSRIESYFRVNCLEPWELGLMMRTAGLASQTDEFFQFIEKMSGTSIERILSIQPLGVSYAVSCQSGPSAFSLFVPAGSVFGGDGNIRRRILEGCHSMGWNLGCYEAISKPLSKRTGWQTWHGIISFVAVCGGPPIFHIGLRPPDISADDQGDHQQTRKQH